MRRFIKGEILRREREKLLEEKYDYLIVLGHGPIKPVLLESELSLEQRRNWEEFKKDPLKNKEPDFFVMESPVYQEELKNSNDPLEIRIKWQKTPRFALNRWARMNALSAGVLLYHNIVEQIIITGGKTIPSWAKENLHPEILQNWPSESELMKNLISNRFRKFYYEKYRKDIEDSIKIETESINTLENFAYTIKKNPEILDKEIKIGLLTSDYHLKRASIIARLFGIDDKIKRNFSSQQELFKRAKIREKISYQEMIKYLIDPFLNQDFKEKLLNEEKLIKALIDSKYIKYWIGFISKITQPEILKRIISILEDNNWKKYAEKVFKEAGIDIENRKDLDELSKDLEKLEIYKDPPLREFPE